MNMTCGHDSIRHIEDATYRGHEIVIAHCNSCMAFIVDVRENDTDGGYIAGYVNKSIYDAINDAQEAIDKHELEKALLVEIPF